MNIDKCKHQNLIFLGYHNTFSLFNSKSALHSCVKCGTILALEKNKDKSKSENILIRIAL